MIQTYRYVSTFRAISSWTLAFPGYLYNQRYPYVEVVIRINFNIKHGFIYPAPQTKLPRTSCCTISSNSCNAMGHSSVAATAAAAVLKDTTSGHISERRDKHHCHWPPQILKIPYLEKPNMDVDVLKKMDMWKTYSCHNMYLVVLSYIFGKRWWLSCNCTRSDTRRDVASLSIIPYRLTALQARKPDECGNSAWNGRGIETMQNFLSSVRHCIAYCLRYIGRAAPNNPYMQPTAS